MVTGVFTCVDWFTRWPKAFSLIDITAESVARAFTFGWIARLGVPSTVIADRSRFRIEPVDSTKPTLQYLTTTYNSLPSCYKRNGGMPIQSDFCFTVLLGKTAGPNFLCWRTLWTLLVKNCRTQLSMLKDTMNTWLPAALAHTSHILYTWICIPALMCSSDMMPRNYAPTDIPWIIQSSWAQGTIFCGWTL